MSAEVDLKGKKRPHNGMDDIPSLGDILSEPTPSEADDLVSTNVPSEGDMLNEQTWPTEEEIANAPVNGGGNGEILPPALPGTTPRRLKKVPKGTSVYQAAWIPDEDDDDEAYGYSEDEDGQTGEGEFKEPPLLQDDEEEYEYIDMDAGTDAKATSTSGVGGHQDLPMDIENAQYQTYLENKRQSASDRQKESKDDLEFPDEVDTPLEIAARERFARYRGLKSFRTSKWDPYENLPRDYARCFMFTDYKVMSKKLAARAAEEGVEVGCRRSTPFVAAILNRLAARYACHGVHQWRASSCGFAAYCLAPDGAIRPAEARAQVLRRELHLRTKHRIHTRRQVEGQPDYSTWVPAIQHQPPVVSAHSG